MFVVFGLLIGFAAAVPLGPVNFYVVSQTFKHDLIHGLMAGLTTAIMDTIYCLIALVGFFQFKFNLAPYLGWMKGAATLLLVGLGARLIRQAAKADVPAVSEKKTIKSSRPVFGVILLYLSNPTLYAFWIAIAGTATAHHLVTNTGWTPVVFAIACGLGSMIWYVLLVSYVAKHQQKIKPASMRRLLLLMGIALIGFGLYTFVRIFV